MKNQSTTERAKNARAVVKLGASRQVVIPKGIHDRLGLRPGDYLEVELEQDRVVLTPKTLVEKRLAEALRDIERGRIHGPFKSAEELVARLRSGNSPR